MPIVHLDQLTVRLLAKHRPRMLIVPWWYDSDLPGTVRCARCLSEDMEHSPPEALVRAHSFTRTSEATYSHCPYCGVAMIAHPKPTLEKTP